MAQADMTPGNFTVVADAQALAAAAADRLVAATDANGGRPAVCLTGGSTPEALYRLLGSPDYASRIPWARVHWFIGDERFVPASDPRNNMGLAREAFLDRCAPADNIHPIPTDVPGPEDAARLYASELQTFYGRDRLDPARPLFDLVLMGVGPDGHTASLFPGGNGLQERTRWVLGVAKANAAPFVPRVTLTPPALASSRQMLFLVSGADKRAILAKIRAGADLPAAQVHSNGTTTWLVDQAAWQTA